MSHLAINEAYFPSLVEDAKDYSCDVLYRIAISPSSPGVLNGGLPIWRHILAYSGQQIFPKATFFLMLLLSSQNLGKAAHFFL